jgi:hypothetical protein
MATELGRPELAPRRSPQRRLGYRLSLWLPGLSQPIHVIGLDTAWLAGDDETAGSGQWAAPAVETGSTSRTSVPPVVPLP